ncbi:RNA polymerase sigma factor [Paenibacillus sp. D51F]|uniref:RNA polymerase sigma factor n=1 Tax=unclassified Paenibacillus TaxID=185978 RepID=UPI000956D823|nr:MULTISPECIES: RNA polymerase sigma factor [unclassified Paenibacillus]ASS68913.1 RNA polymerase sigma factor [Paenibacillus sp. RUD330]SIR15060.1 RNA polymerase sigma-70 factor, ECF subfamily [Paenibacillus sp. RU4X]SIR22924.1 RNA polymerase sigma-70 factor, ECF subfamily [Paenibacillus sp. RU4T]
MTDEELVQGMMDGDQACFEALVHRYHAPLSGFLQRQLKDPGRAEDVVQETFLKLIRQLKDRRNPENVQAWLYRVAMNQCRDYWKSSAYQTDRNRFGEPPERKDERPSVVELAERQETRREISQSLEELPQVQREVVMLRFYQDLKLQDIADVLQLPLGSVKTHLYKALRRLKTRLAGDKNARVRAEGGKQDGIAE